MSRNITYKYWIATGTLVLLLLVSSVLLSFYIILDNNEKVYDKQINSINSFFLKDIRNDILQFNNFEVYSKCKNFYTDSLVVRIRVSNLSTNELLCDLEEKKYEFSGIDIDSYVYFDSDQKSKAAEIRVSYARKSTLELLKENTFFILTIFLALLIVTYFALKKVSSVLFSDLVVLSSYLDGSSLSDLIALESKFKNQLSSEISVLVDKITMLAKRLFDSQRELLRQSELFAKAEVATQVAHDIRSPLMSLKIAADKLEGDPKIKDLLLKSVNRIEGISEDLLKKHRKSNQDVNHTVAKGKNIQQMIQDVVLEKKSLFPIVNFDLSLSPNSQQVFYSNELERIISNLIQNSIEAFSPDHPNPVIKISMSKADEPSNNRSLVNLIISDNGKGIPPEILPKLFQKGATFGKENGNGLGLSYAKEYLESKNCSIGLSSKVGLGTSIEITLSM